MPLPEPYPEMVAVSLGRRGAPEVLRPRIAVVAAGLEILGGQGIQAKALSEGLTRLGYPLSFCPVNPAFPRSLAWVKALRCVRTLLNEALFVPSLARIRAADVVHVFSASYFSFLLGPAPAIAVARALGKRVILNYHSGEADDHLRRWGRAVHPFLRMAHEIVVPSDYLRGIFARYGYTVRVIPNVVDLEHFRFRERSPLRARILSTRNLEPHYGVDHTLRAFALLRASRPEATLTIAGYGSEERPLRTLAAALGAEGVHFLGRIEPSAMPALYDAADIFVNSSLIDNQPVSILESQASGLPVVSTPSGDIPSLVRNGETGVLVPSEDPPAMAQAILGLLREGEHAAAIARRAREEVERFTWTEVEREWGALYAGVCR
jgi:glycosyltransferase involved in cell wall biosynthesis